MDSATTGVGLVANPITSVKPSEGVTTIVTARSCGITGTGSGHSPSYNGATIGTPADTRASARS